MFKVGLDRRHFWSLLGGQGRTYLNWPIWGSYIGFHFKVERISVDKLNEKNELGIINSTLPKITEQLSAHANTLKLKKEY